MVRMRSRPKVLFIARRFPPSVGGMQKFAYDLSRALSEETARFEIIAWGGSNVWLPIILPWLFLRATSSLIRARDYDILHIQDGLLAPVGWLLHVIFQKPYVVVAHGLDITYPNPLYKPVLWFVRRATAVVSISQATAKEVLNIGVDPHRSFVITPGINDATKGIKVNKTELSEIAGIKLSPKNTILLSLGRLVKRKGMAWFINNVLPDIVRRHPNVVYLIAGEGAERSNIERTVEALAMQRNVVLLGKVSDELKTKLYQACDIFVMPNIVVPGDMEGFGLVAQEAAVAGLAVVASNLEGIGDALQEGKNASLVMPENPKAFGYEIERLINDSKLCQATGKAAREYTIANFDWSEKAKRYIEIYENILTRKS